MFTRALLFLACMLPVLYAGWPRPSLLGVSLSAGAGVQGQEWRALNMDLDSLRIWSGMRIYDLQDGLPDGFDFHGRCQRRDCLIDAGKAAGLDYVWSGGLERVGDQWLLSFRWLSVRHPHGEEVMVRTLRAGDVPGVQRVIREWLIARPYKNKTS